MPGRAQFSLCCPCGSMDGLWARGLCRRCYDAQLRNQKRFEGKRDLILERDGGCCVLCPSMEDLIVHHRSLRRYATLCRAHHARVHHLVRLRGLMPHLFQVLWEEQNGRSRQLELPLVLSGDAVVAPTEQQTLFFAA